MPKIRIRKPVFIDGACVIRLSGGKTSYINPEDADIIGQFTWMYQKSVNTGYGVRRVRRPGAKVHAVFIHRVVMSRMLGRYLDEEEEVDHIDRNGLNNLRSNLRLATRTQNIFNRATPSNNTSGYKGVVLRRGRWVVRITAYGVTTHVGSFATKEEAVAAYSDAAIKIHKEFACLS